MKTKTRVKVKVKRQRKKKSKGFKFQELVESGGLTSARSALGLNQELFWGPIGVTQSGGSRYEAGRRIPKPVDLLLKMVYCQNGAQVLAKLRAQAGIS